MKKAIITAILIIFSLSISNFSYAQEKNKKNRNHSRSSASSMPQKIAATGEKVFVFNPRTTSWAAYDASGNRLSSGTANGGSNYCPDVKRGCHTPVGSFRVHSKGSAGCVSTRYPIKHTRHGVVRGGAHMPHCMFFTTNYAIHGYDHLTNSNVSHGCIRVSNSAARWLHSNFINVGTRVRVLSY